MHQLHVSLRGKRCVYCQYVCEDGEAVVAVLGSLRHIGRTDIFEMPLPGQSNQRFLPVHLKQRNSLLSPLCLRPDCSACKSSPDSYLAHKVCLDVRTNILPGTATCEEVWSLGSATRPWFLSPEKEVIFRPSKLALVDLFPLLHFDDTGTKELIGRLLALPEELFRIIMWEMAERSTLSRVTLISQLDIGWLKELKLKRLVTKLDFANDKLRRYGMNFLGVQYQPYLSKGHIPDRAMIRVGADDFGIRHVEIMEANGPGSRKCPWYMVERFERALSLFNIESNGPFLRICRRTQEPVQLWSVPNPPEHGTYSSIGKYSTSTRRTRCLDMTRATGLTIFCDTQSIYGIYAHHADESAINAYQSLCRRSRYNVMWRYFPLSPGEMITSAWTRSNPGSLDGTSLVLLTSCGRSCFFGAPCAEGDTPYLTLCDTSMQHLLYDDPSPEEPISWFGAAPKLSSSPSMDLDVFGTEPDLHHTQASLVDVVQANVYSNEHGSSTGILFRYSNGSSECIGQRRFGMANTKTTTVKHPARIYFRTFELRIADDRMIAVKYECVEVRFSSSISESFLDGWESQEMKGSATWLFTKSEDLLQLSLEPLKKRSQTRDSPCY